MNKIGVCVLAVHLELIISVAHCFHESNGKVFGVTERKFLRSRLSMTDSHELHDSILTVCIIFLCFQLLLSSAFTLKRLECSANEKRKQFRRLFFFLAMCVHTEVEIRLSYY